MQKLIITLIRAFSLTELMIVVAIVAFLSAIALPNYKAYVNKATVTNMISIVDPCQTQVYQYFLQNATFPDPVGTPSSIVACYGQSLSVTPALLKDNVYVAYTVNTSGGGNKYAQFKVQSSSIKVNNTLANLYIIFTQGGSSVSFGGGDLVYNCGALSGDTNSMPTNYLPSGCNSLISP